MQLIANRTKPSPGSFWGNSQFEEPDLSDMIGEMLKKPPFEVTSDVSEEGKALFELVQRLKPRESISAELIESRRAKLELLE